MIEGWLDEVSETHVGGYMHDPASPGQRFAFDVILPSTGERLASGWADRFRLGLKTTGVGDGLHAFHTRLPRPLRPAEQAEIAVRSRASGELLRRHPSARTAFEPVLHVAMDIVDNCNLRCPFCLYDYANTRTTHFMSEATLERALPLLPLTRDGEFWFSCLHEPTLHPSLTAFIDHVPAVYRRKLFYTTNLAKRMPDSYYEWLADSGMHHINISIESRDPALYERMRKGARHRIFAENWQKLLATLPQGSAPPRLRYITMVYKSNLRELPELVRFLLDEAQAAQVELRYTFDVPHIDPAFKSTEFLDKEDWQWLRDRLGYYPADKVQLELPPADYWRADEQAARGSLSASDPVLSDYLLVRLSWDGRLEVRGFATSSSDEAPIEREILTTTIEAVVDPLVFVSSLPTEAGALGGP